jgi:hypothetical protein
LIKNNYRIIPHKSVVITITNVHVPDDSARETYKTISNLGLLTAGYKLSQNIPSKAGKAAVLGASTILAQGINYTTNMINSSNN